MLEDRGVVAAAVAHGPTEHEVWAVAYLVLVPGVCQIALGVGQAVLAREEPATPTLTGQLLAFNVGSGLVIGGTVTDHPVITYVGSLLLVISLAMFIILARGVRLRALRWIYRVLVAIVLVSIPIGLIIQQVKGQ